MVEQFELDNSRLDSVNTLHRYEEVDQTEFEFRKPSVARQIGGTPNHSQKPLRTYCSDQLRRFFDEYGEREWQRLVTRPSDEASFFVHSHYLRQFIRPGSHVLELGAGPGRFTIELARLGVQVTVGDISRVQLDLNAQHVRDAGYEEFVRSRPQVDAADLSCFGDNSFDAVVCYGGVLSYLFDRAQAAAAEMNRVLRPGGYCLASVMSRLYNLRKQDVIRTLFAASPNGACESYEHVYTSGDYTGPIAQGHEMRLYDSFTLGSLFRTAGFDIVAATSANCLSAGNDQQLEPVRADPALWSRFLDCELAEGQRPGALDAGHHLIMAGRKGGQA